MKKNNNKPFKKDKEKNKYLILSIISIILIIAVIVVGIFLNKDKKEEKAILKENEISYSELIKQINDNSVEQIKMTIGSSTLEVKLKSDEEIKKVSMKDTSALVEFVQNKVEQGSDIELIQEKESPILTVGSRIFSLIPTIIFLIVVILLFQMQGLGDKGKVYDAAEEKSKVTFDDVAGMDEEKEEMVEIVNFLKKPDDFYKMGAKIPRGVLLCGDPGTGKTLIARAIAGEAGVPFIPMSGSEFIEMFAGLGASRVRKLFDKAKKLAPCIIFIDEIDAIGSRRTNASGAETENNQTLNQLLVEMDGFDNDNTVIVLAATNRPEMLDKALLRPGRFDRQIRIGLPDLNGREAILKIHAKNKKIDEEVDLRSIASNTAGFSGAELANVLNEAAIIATTRKEKSINNKDIEDAVKKVTVGIEKHSKIMSEKDKKLTAYHEAGHAVVSHFLDTQKDIKEISIIPRGIAGGYTMYKTNEDKYYISKTEMKEKLVALLGGRTAEKLIIKDVSTGASNDLEVATEIAKKMITVYGMSDNISPISLNMEKDPYQLQLFGDKIEDEIGKEINLLIDEASKKAEKILVEHIDKLHELAALLIEKEVVSEEEFEELFK